jgi:hypothetical protein
MPRHNQGQGPLHSGPERGLVDDNTAGTSGKPDGRQSDSFAYIDTSGNPRIMVTIIFTTAMTEESTQAELAREAGA